MKQFSEEQLVIYQRVIDAAPDIIHIISPDMRIILRNKRSREWFPLVQVGEHCYRTLHNRDSICPHCFVCRVFEDGKRHEHESLIKGNSPEENIILHSTASPIYDDQGNILGALEILRDITERKKLEQALRDTAERLSRANRIRELLLRMVRHDLGTPAGVILNTTEYLLEEPASLGDLKEDIEDIYRSANHILQLIHDADVLSKVLTATHVKFKDIDLSGLLSGLFDQIGPLLKKANVKLESRLPDKLTIKGLPILKTAFENILVNAVKYGASGGRLIVEVSEEDSYVVIEITDFGPGIPDEYKSRIFEQFERLATDVPGTGLGLAIAGQSVELHGGTIKVRDNPAGGAIFEIRLPKDGRELQSSEEEISTAQ